MFKILFLIMTVIILISILFNLASKSFKLDQFMMSTFECGFTSYFFSRFSFSIHYFFLGLIFLFLDLELCFIMPFFSCSLSSMKMVLLLNIFMMVILMGLIQEWKEGNLEWIY